MARRKAIAMFMLWNPNQSAAFNKSNPQTKFKIKKLKLNSKLLMIYQNQLVGYT